MSKNNHNFFYPLVFPFYQKKWLSRTWWLNLIAIIPIVDLIIFTGWRRKLIRNMAYNEEHILPKAELLSFFKHGIILWIVATLFLIIPMILIFTVGSGAGGSIIEFGSWFVGLVTQDPNTISTKEMLASQGNDFIIRVLIEIVWALVSIPILSTGLMRYAITEKIGTLFNLPVNTMYAIKYIGPHFMMWIFKFFLIIFVAVVTSLLISSVVLAILAPMFALSIYYWSTGYEFGHLAEKIKMDMER